MVAGETTRVNEPATSERLFPPVVEVALASMSLVIAGGIYIASYVPHTVPLGPPIFLLTGAAVLLAADVVVLRRLQHFAWERFFQIFRWTLVAYAVIAGMIGYVFVVDGTRGSLLVVVISMLVIFSIDIPILLSFSVARYEDEPSA